MNILLAYYVLHTSPVSSYKVYLSDSVSNVKPVLAQIYKRNTLDKVNYDTVIDEVVLKLLEWPSSGTISEVNGTK